MAWYNFRKNALKLKELETTKRDLESLSKEFQDFKLAIGSKTLSPAEISEVLKSQKKTLSRPLSYRSPNISSYGASRRDINNTYYGPIYDLAEIARAIDVEPYIAQSVRKHREQILKEGYSFNGSEDEMVDYINNRIFEIELVSGVSFGSIIREFTTNLVSYATAFIVIRRDKERSSGRRTRLYGKELEPIAALYPMDSTSVSVSLNKHGHPIRWKQTVVNAHGDSNTITFENSDIIVATIDKKSGFNFGTPYILPTLDDVRSLRRMEEITEVIAHKHAFGMVHWKVGSDDAPAQIYDDGADDISIVKAQVEDISAEGGIVTSHRVEANVLGAERQVLDTSKMLDYFERRVMGGLRLSEIDIGRGEVSKASATTVSQGLQDSAKDFQAVMEDCLNYQLIIPLLHEGGFDITQENKVSIQFNMINREEERSRQQHGQDLFLGDTITCEEYRKDYLNKKPLSEEDTETCTHSGIQHQRDKEIQEMANAAAVAKARARPASKKTTSSNSIKRKVQNKVRPRNQSGQKAIKTRVTANNSFDGNLMIHEQNSLAHLKDLQDLVLDFVIKNKNGKGASGDALDMTTREEELESIMRLYNINSTLEARQMLEPIIEYGIDDCLKLIDSAMSYKVPKKIMDRFFKNFVSKSYQRIGSICTDLIENNETLTLVDNILSPQLAVQSIFKQLNDEVLNLCSKHIIIAYRFGFARAAKNNDYDSVVFEPVEDNVCPECEANGEFAVCITSKDISLTSVLSTHNGCQFDIKLGNK